MIFCDTGPLVALVNRNDSNHQICSDAVKGLAGVPLLTTWPCLTEAMYLADRVGGHRAQAMIWRLRDSERLTLHDLTSGEVDHMGELMEKYRDLPMDLADASLIATADSLGIRRIFTLDSHFLVYRLRDGSAMQVVP